MPFRSVIAFVVFSTAFNSIEPAVHAQSAAASMIRLLKSGRIPPERQGNVIKLIGQRGDAADLGFLFEQAVLDSEGFNAENRLAALNSLATATRSRKVVPQGDLTRLKNLLESDVETRLAAIQLVALWKVDSLSGELKFLLGDDEASNSMKSAAIDALVALGPEHARSAVETLLHPEAPIKTRFRGAALLAEIDLTRAAEEAASLLKLSTDQYRPDAMIEALLQHREGPSQLAAAIEKDPPSGDTAKLALRAIYGAGRSDASLVSVLNEIAGIEQGPVQLSEQELVAFVGRVKESGDPTRGEKIFRREELNCLKCHALSKAGGQIGPDLSAVGKTSPPDYIIRSLLDPDESIKEAFETRAVQTSDGKTWFGILADETDEQLVLRDANGKEIIIPIDDIVAEKKGGSLMPKGLTSFLTDQELVDLVSFVSELGKAGPYEIRATRSLQRWRVLKDPDELLLAEIHDANTFADAVLGTAESRWEPFYATVAGFVPLNEIEAYRAGQPVFLYGEIEVTSAGRVGIKIDNSAGVNLWVADRDFGISEQFEVGLPEGRHRITVRVVPSDRATDRIRLNFSAPLESAANYTVVGGV